MRTPRPRLMPLAAVAALACAAQAAETLTYADLIARMTRPELLAVLPPAGEACAQWSSYDRASRYDAATDKYVNWDANGDGNGVIRTEGDAVVMAEMQGPGASSASGRPSRSRAGSRSTWTETPSPW